MTWLALTSAIAVGVAVGIEASKWLATFLGPLRNIIDQWFDDGGLLG